MIDLSPMRGIRVDPLGQTVRAEPGLTWGDFDRETQAFGLATTGGLFSTTGIAGLTLGGGLGWLHGLYGLACDNLLSADVITADGRLLTASATEHPDLFWGLRGGGGNFGIVPCYIGAVADDVGRNAAARPKELLEVEPLAQPRRRSHRDLDCLRASGAFAHFAAHA
jgi:FAD/FMN-containing dehydrogenase